MAKLLFLFPVGVFSHCLMPALPPPWLLLLLLALTLPLVLAGRRWGEWPPLVAVLLLGFTLGSLWGHQQLQHRLPLALDKTDVTVIGEVDSLVLARGGAARFNFRVRDVLGPHSSQLPDLRGLRLSWYGGTAAEPGETWQLRLRLRTPRGFANPGGFDYSAWLMAQGISATGYVRESSDNRRLAPAPASSLHHWRGVLLDRLLAREDLDPRVLGVMAALILGEQGLIPRASFDRFQLSGTVHLVVVSGLHIGMVCGLGFLVGLGIGRVAAALGAVTPARILAIPVALAAGGGYSLLAGFDLPIQRALIMSAAALVALAARRAVHIWRVIALALCLVALLDPLAVLSAGFWLSFMAVVGLVGWFSYRPPVGRWRQLLQAQAVVFVSLAPWLIYFQGRATLWALPVNLVAIPWVSVAIVPCCLLGALFQFIPPVGDFFWTLAALQLDAFLRALSLLEHPSADLVPLLRLPTANPQILAALTLAALLLLLPRGLGKRMPLLVLLVSLFFVRVKSGAEMELAVLDVGQGLAAVVRVGERVLIYDTGPGFPSGFNTGEAVVAPYLGTLGITVVDRLIVSHADMDHAGGVGGLLKQVAAEQVLSGQPERLSVFGKRPMKVESCQRGQGWRWGGATIRVLWPPPEAVAETPPMRKDNNSSCVVLIELGDVRVLLPGDIEAEVEQYLVAQYGEDLAQLAVLVAPHHGSKSSSSAGFLRAATPRHAVFAAGFNHHFGHPHPEVVGRYRQVGTAVWNTADSGALIFRWRGGELTISERRRVHRRYWH